MPWAWKGHMRARLITAFACLVLALVNSEVVAGIHIRIPTPQVSVAPLNAGLVGVKVADPAIEIATRDSSGIQVPLTGFKRIIADASYRWAPGVDTGLIFRFAAVADSNRGAFGIGAHFVVFQVQGEDKPRTAPALTLHYGTKDLQAFIGMLFTPRGDVRLPGGKDEVIVPNGLEHAFDTTSSSRGSARNLYGGIVLKTFRI